ncbi:MAG: hypothetical protein IPJ82_10705 [Lewinellaceae bacterium]|nr:hypothetical protein [Lewinellaceae bacterium]
MLRIYLLSFALHFALLPLYGFTSDWFTGHWQYITEEVWAAYLCLYVFLAGVLLPLGLYDLSAKKFRRGWTIPQLLEVQYRAIPLKHALILFIVLVGFLLGYNIYFGFVSYASSTLERNLAVPYPIVVLKSLASILLLGLVGYGALHLIRGRQYMLLGLLLLCSNNFLNLYSRRTYLLALIILILFKLLLDRLRISIRQVLIVGAVGLFVLQVFFPFLYVFRLLTIEEPEAKRKSIFDFADL